MELLKDLHLAKLVDLELLVEQLVVQQRRVCQNFAKKKFVPN